MFIGGELRVRAARWTISYYHSTNNVVFFDCLSVQHERS